MHTVLIDDDATALFLSERLLRHEGISDVLAFTSPHDALAYLLKQIPAGLVTQVILLDLNMPLVSGWDFLDILQRHEEQLLGQCVVFLLTSSLAPADKTRGQAHPLVAGFLQKPLNKEKIQQIWDHARPAAPSAKAGLARLASTSSAARARVLTVARGMPNRSAAWDWV